MRRVKYGREGRQIERCHKHEQMAEKRVGESEKRERRRATGRQRKREREGEKSGSG